MLFRLVQAQAIPSGIYHRKGCAQDENKCALPWFPGALWYCPRWYFLPSYLVPEAVVRELVSLLVNEVVAPALELLHLESYKAA